MNLQDATISDLFSKEPIEWTDEDLMRAVTYYRQQRIALVEADAAGKRAPRTKTIKAPTEIDSLSEGLDL